MQGRGGFPGGGGGFPGGGPNMQGRGGFPGGGGGFPGGGFPGGGFPGMAFPQRRSETATTTAAPLVPEFGETVAASPAVLKFGDYAETISTSGAMRSIAVTAQDDTLQKQINDQAQQLMTRYDKDKNGMIEKSTGEWSNIRIDTNVADTNRDGRITLDELRVYVGNQLRGGTGGAKVFTSYATTYEHMPEGIPSWFTDRDKDNDGQLTLFEYANGQPITDGMVSEFEWLDLNNDGIATLAECYSAIKTKEELERKKLEEQQGGPQGGNQPGHGPRDRDRRNVGNNEGASFTPSADRPPEGENGDRGPGSRGNRPGGSRGDYQGGPGGRGGYQGNPGGSRWQRDGGGNGGPGMSRPSRGDGATSAN